MAYKQNTGVLSKNQSILKRANVIFSVNESTTETNINYRLSRCNGCYFLSLNVNEINYLTLTPSTSCYDIEVNVNQEAVYKENGSVIVNLNQVLIDELCIKIRINRNEAILISYQGNISGNKVIALK